MDPKTVTVSFLLLALALTQGTAEAVCWYPKTAISGYQIPLSAEVRDADAIILGRVLSEQGLKEDMTDPDGVTAYNVAVRVLSSLKGHLPPRIVIRNENTSARYPMSVGEVHILFISRTTQGLLVDSCGNSTLLPQGEPLIRQIRAELRSLK